MAISLTKNQTFLIQQLSKQIEQFFEQKNVNLLLKTLKNKPIDVIVHALEEINDSQIIIFVLIAIKDTICTDVFKSINIELRSTIIEEATIQQLRVILFELFNDDIVILMKDLPSLKMKILHSLDSNQRAAIRQLADYDENYAYSLANTDFFTLNEDFTIRETLVEIKRIQDDYERNNIMYVTNNMSKLVGSISMHSLLFADSYDIKLKEIVDSSIITLHKNDDIDDVVKAFKKYELEQLAIIDENEHLVGYITDNDIQPYMDVETTVDIYKMYGITKSDFPYIKSSPVVLFKSRFFWLVLLMIAATVTAFLIDRFQDVGQTMTAGLSTLIIVPIIPAVTGTTGNAGSQSAASIIRALSIGDITVKEYGKTILKELLASSLIAFILALVNFLRLVVYFAIIPPKIHSSGIVITTITDPMIVGLIIASSTSLSLFIATVVSKFLGCSLPFFATRVKADPTIMSAPILSTLCDMITTVVLFGFGILFLIFIIDKGNVDQINMLHQPKSEVASTIQSYLNIGGNYE